MAEKRIEASVELHEATGCILVREEILTIDDEGSVTDRQNHRYVLHPGDDLDGRSEKIVSLARARWTPEIVAAYRAAAAAAEEEVIR